MTGRTLQRPNVCTLGLVDRMRAAFHGRSPLTTAADIRAELHALRRQHAVTVQQRDLVAFDAVRDDAAAVRWQHLDDTAAGMTQRMQVLTAALPKADASEQEAAEQAEAVRREQVMWDYERQTAEAQEWLDAVLARLASGEELTRARDWRDRLAAGAREIRAWSNDVRVRRPLDPLGAIVSAMQHRIERVSRARHAPQHPITIDGGVSPEGVAAAIARVGGTQT